MGLEAFLESTPPRQIEGEHQDEVEELLRRHASPRLLLGIAGLAPALLIATITGAAAGLLAFGLALVGGLLIFFPIAMRVVHRVRAEAVNVLVNARLHRGTVIELHEETLRSRAGRFRAKAFLVRYDAAAGTETCAYKVDEELIAREGVTLEAGMTLPLLVVAEKPRERFVIIGKLMRMTIHDESW